MTDIDVHSSTQDYHAHDQTMDKDGGIDKVLGVMLAPVNKGESINLSIESTNGGDSSMQSSEMKVDYNKPLSEVLESIFSLSGKVLITFPNASYAEVRV